MVQAEQIEEHTQQEEPFGLGCALEHFTEHEEVFRLIDSLPNIANAGQSTIDRTSERTYERFSFILSQYIEQPHLLDSHIDAILEKMIGIIRDTSNTMKLKHLIFKYMFVLVNVRGYKVVVRHLPHEVADFEPVLQLLESQDPEDAENWTTRYILLLWLSIIVMIPFHMSRFDGFVETEQKTVMTRILDVIKTYVLVTDKCRDAAAFLSYKFITRNDVKEAHLESYLDWAISLSLKRESNIFMKHGLLASVAMIIKHGKRDDLLPHARKLLNEIMRDEFKSNSGTNIQKLVFKIIQRIGLTFLPPRNVSWRYKRGNRSLAANLSAGDGKIPNNSQINRLDNIEDSNEDIEVVDEVEEVIDQLIQGLRNSDGVVRWSTAKGIGRVTGRLPKELADEVVGSVLELFSPREGDSAWHGGCLALAELGRRGLLLPERLPQVVPVVLKALVYDEPRGYSSVGSHIRDAACYVCWSFARAYDTHDLEPFINDIASTLLIVTCFDKEINCRRAASAAFQENVGRQGQFPHGIDILTTADFFAVSIRSNAYLNVSVYVAQFQEYTLPLIDHLIERKVDHWDTAIRELTAKTLHNLTQRAPEYMLNKVLPNLFEKSNTIDLNNRHGSVLAIGEIVYALSKIAKDDHKQIGDILSVELKENVKNLVPRFRERLYFRGLGGELMRQACSDFIEKCSLASMPFHDDPVSDDWLSLLNECIAYKAQSVNIRANAINALPVLLQEYFSDLRHVDKIDNLIKLYVNELSSVNLELNRMGHALALGALPKFILKSHNLHFILNSLFESTLIQPTTLKWAESRRDSIRAITSICTTMSEEIGNELTDEDLMKIYHTFLDGLRDYTQDKRGDIGAWMREASMIGLQTLTVLIVMKKPILLTENLITKILCGVSQQAVEKIDRTRALAGKVFYNLIYNQPNIPNIKHYKEICEIFPKNECDDMNWNSAACTFPKFVELLKFQEFTYSVMLGLICSCGGLTETLVKNSSQALYTYLENVIRDDGLPELQRICETIYQIFNDYQKIDRITVPLFRFIDKLFDSGSLSLIIEDANCDFLKRMLKLVQMEITGCKDIYKLIDGINLLCQFIQIRGEVCNTVLTQLSILLCHRQPYVRRSTSTKLYESLLCYGDSSNINQTNLDEVMEVLSSTCWEDNIELIRPVRNNLCTLMGIRVPVPKKKL